MLDHLCSDSLHTSVRVDSDIKLASAFLSPDACIKAPKRPQWTVLHIHTTISQDRVVNHMLVYQRRGDLGVPFNVLIKLFLNMKRSTKIALKLVYKHLVPNNLMTNSVMNTENGKLKSP